MKTLLDLLHEANVIDVDGTLCGSFTLESELDEPDHIALEVSYEEDSNIYEHWITFAELANAERDKSGAWLVTSYNGDWDNTTKIIPYELNELKP